jgi:hypothetical protein
VAIAMEIGGHVAIDPAARKHKGIAAKASGAMEVGVMATAATPIGRMEIAAISTGTAIATRTVPKVAALTATVRKVVVQTVVVVTAIAATLIVTATETVTGEATSVARTQASRPRAFVLTRQWAIARSIHRTRWPAARVMLA